MNPSPPGRADEAIEPTVRAAVERLGEERRADADQAQERVRNLLREPHRERVKRALEAAWDDANPRLRERARRLSSEVLLDDASRDAAASKDARASDRVRMVQEQLFHEGVGDPRVLRAMLQVPREEFVPEKQRRWAYENRPLPIGEGQTISQPFIVAYMTEALGLRGDEKVLEIGTGSGYQAAVLTRLAREVYTIEIVEPLGRRAAETLEKLKYANVHVRMGDGYKGWPEAAPFDAVIVTCAPDHVPAALVEQLRPGGRLVLPMGDDPEAQKLVRLTKTAEGLQREDLLPVRFVPMTGEAKKR